MVNCGLFSAPLNDFLVIHFNGVYKKRVKQIAVNDQKVLMNESQSASGRVQHVGLTEMVLI